jgi:hypothetical protein
MIQRKEYLQKLSAWQDKQVIKVVTGIRRCGKSTLLAQFREKLQKAGVRAEQIISINFEDLDNEGLLDYKELYTYLKSKLVTGATTYIFLDEIQRVVSFEKVVDSLHINENVDIYITGSNSHMLSGDLATLLSGRYIEIKMLPFSFNEFCEATGLTSDKAFSEYIKIGGMPYATAIYQDAEMLSAYMEGIYNTVIVKDIEDRQARRQLGDKQNKITDIALLKSIAKYLTSVVGSPVSVRSITDYLTSNGRKISANTVDNYLTALCESFIFYAADRFDISGKELLKTNKKYYTVDLGLRNYILPKKNYDLGFSIENVVYFEFLRRGYQVNVGKIGNTEIDFVARKSDQIVYCQVTADITAETTFEREMRPLKQIKDNYEKIVLTLDRYTPGNYEGIQVINVVDWLSSAD